MAADFSRIRHHPLLDFAGVELKQGAVLLDADANELVAVLDRRLRALAADVMGPSAVAATTPQGFALSLDGGALEIGPGRLYVDGLMAHNHGTGAAVFDPLLAEPAFAGPTPLTDQPYLPEPLTPPTTGRHLVYLDVWQREITHLERPDVVEPAVNVETSSRLQTVWQVRLLSDLPASAACETAWPAWDALTAPSRGRLSTATIELPPGDDPCELPPTGGYRGLENQLYRVEVHDPGLPGAGATFKWSRENASVGARVTAVLAADTLELDSLGRDAVLGIAEGDWVELIDDAAELGQRGGSLHRIGAVDADNRRITLASPLPASLRPAAMPSSDWPAQRNLRLLRWDQRGAVFRAGSDTPIQDLGAPAAGDTPGAIGMPAAGVAVVLEHGITVAFDAVAGDGPGFRRGDWWVFAARTADASIETLDQAPPRGIHHHHTRLGFWDVDAGAVTDCRTLWPPAAGGGDCACTVCVSPQSHADGSLTIQAAVDRVRERGGSVCLQAGQYPLSEPVRIHGAVSLAIRGQGPATVITAPGTAWSIVGAAALTLEKLSVVSLGAGSAITARTVAGLRLSELALMVLDQRDSASAAIGLSGLCAGVSIRDNLIIAPDGIRNEAAQGDGKPLLLSAALQVQGNLLWCRRRGLALQGPVVQWMAHRIEANEVLGCRDGGLSVQGLSLPGAATHIERNTLSVNGPGITAGTDACWITGNRLQAERFASRSVRGSAITLAAGLEAAGQAAASNAASTQISTQVQVRSNHISGFDAAGLLVDAPLGDLVCAHNTIELCGAGIVMSGQAEGSALSIHHNHLRNLTGGGQGLDDGLAVGIGLSRVDSASLTGNQIQGVGVAASDTQIIAGVLLLGVRCAQLQGNLIRAIGPLAEFSGMAAGIMARAPLGEIDVSANRIERDAQPQSAPGNALWTALWIEDQPRLGLVDVDGRNAAPVMRTAKATTVRIDERRTLVLTGQRATVMMAHRDTLAAAPGAGEVSAPINGDLIAPAAGGGGSAVNIQGNTLSARGRAPAVRVVVDSDALLGNNRITHLGARVPGLTAVALRAHVALLSGNRVRGTNDVAVAIVSARSVVAMGNITRGAIHLNGSALPAPWAALNVPG